MRYEARKDNGIDLYVGDKLAGSIWQVGNSVVYKVNGHDGVAPNYLLAAIEIEDKFKESVIHE